MTRLKSLLLIHLQDIFGAIPGDTDYRIFANDHGDIPGLDIIFVLGAYFYHTASDTVERLLYASTGILILFSGFVFSRSHSFFVFALN